MKRSKNKKRLAALAGLLVCFCLVMLPATALAEPENKKIITVAGDAYFPPFEFLDERDGLKVYRGFNIDLIRVVIAKTDLELQFLPLPWEEALRALQEGRVDAVGGMKYDAERAHYFDFSEEYLISSLAIFVARDNSIIVELSDLENRRIAVQKDDITYQKLKNRVLELTATVTQEEAIKLLLAGKVDAVVGNRMAGQYIVQRLGAMERVKSVGGFINPERYGFAVRRGNEELLAKFNEGLRKVKTDGTFDQIYFKWFGEPVDYPAYYYKKYLSYLGLGLLAALLLASWQSFIQQGYLLDPAGPGLVIGFAFAVTSLYRHRVSEREQRWIREAFSRYVSPNRVAYLLEHRDTLQLGGKRQSGSFIFTDLANFTSLMEAHDPAVMTSVLNEYLDGMIAIVFKHEGTLDRIIGDAVAAVFSAPVEQTDHAARAYRCALEMYAFSTHFAADCQQRGLPFGYTRIGVHTGEVIVGNFGGSSMFDYRALGDAVNTAARLESVNKHLGTRFCVSAATLASIPDAAVRPTARLILKGRHQALATFEPLPAAADHPQAPLADYLAAYQLMANDSPVAREQFAQLATNWPDDPLVALHHARLQAGERGDIIAMHEK